MAEGLRKHHHVFANVEEHQRYDRKKHCIRKDIHKMCMICGIDHWEHKTIPVKRNREKRA